MNIDWQILTEDTLIARAGVYTLHAEERDYNVWVWQIVRGGRCVSSGESQDGGTAMASAEIGLNKITQK